MIIAGYKLIKSQKKVNYLLYMDDIKLLVKNKNELETLIHTIRIYSQEKGMEFGLEKCTMFVKSGKRHLKDDWNYQFKIKFEARRKGNQKYLDILEADNFKQEEMKEKIKKEYFRRKRKLLEAKQYCRNLIEGINTWAVSLVSYSGPFLKCTRE